MMLFVGIYVNNFFIFLVSVLTVFQSWLLRDGSVVFFSDNVFLIVSTFIFSYCVSVCFVFGCVVF